MYIELKPAQKQFVQKQLEKGRFNTVDELFDMALMLLEQDQRLEELRHQIDVGTEQIQQGKVVDGEAVFDHLQAKISNMSPPEA
ncbi:type II toxin-antitoxin system ParD family antitoxin [Acaryochloris marina]|uniref:ribbon-helix-helix domain-containing protein n=1 Tax=Acaryochloris marina TaxID=155978 RepID=UPI001BAF99DC|nr:type II toxin-antitoxin system ParD family antitoxin [Acaryochloris marina]QUY43769.1 type II toxin-antitoxin system ParD family antitoxin [Acaryochloris marina S15]